MGLPEKPEMLLWEADGFTEGLLLEEETREYEEESNLLMDGFVRLQVGVGLCLRRCPNLA